jgi:hypothetical protein
MDECGGRRRRRRRRRLTGDGDEGTAIDDSTGEADGRMAADGEDDTCQRRQVVRGTDGGTDGGASYWRYTDGATLSHVCPIYKVGVSQGAPAQPHPASLYQILDAGIFFWVSVASIVCQ